MGDIINLGAILLFYITGVQCEQCSYQLDSGYLTHGYLNCPGYCCGTYSDRYCCSISNTYTNVGTIVGVVVGSGVFLMIIVLIIVAVWGCYKRSLGQANKIFQKVYSLGGPYDLPTTNPGYGQTGYAIGAYSGEQIQTDNLRPGTAQRWEAPPTLNERTSP